MSKTKAQRDHLSLVHELPCVACFMLGLTLPECREIEAHHLESVRDEWSDYGAVPLGVFHHRELHRLSRRGFERTTKLTDLDLLAGTVALIRMKQ